MNELRIRGRTADGTEMDVGAGDVNLLPPGHDGWVVGGRARRRCRPGAHVWGKPRE